MTPAAVVFDLYGTMLEIGSLRTAAARISPDPDAFVAAWRQKQLDYAFAAAIMGRYEDFDRLTRYALHHTAAGAGVHIGREDLDALMGAWQTVRAYDDVVPSLTAVRGRGWKTAVLTNGTRKSARAALTHAGAFELVDVLLSVEDVETYKPDPAAYRIATRRFEAAPEQLVFVTSNGWDATGAREFGLTVVWCNRAGAAVETFGRRPAPRSASPSSPRPSTPSPTEKCIRVKKNQRMLGEKEHDDGASAAASCDGTGAVASSDRGPHALGVGGAQPGAERLRSNRSSMKAGESGW